MELTKDYFNKQFNSLEKRLDKKFKKFATKEDLKSLTKDLESKFATKSDLHSQTKELKIFAEEQTDILARIIASTVAEPMKRHF